MKVLVLLASLLIAVQVNASILSLSVPGSVSGTLNSESGWLSGDTSAIDFYTFELSSETTLSFSLETAFTSMGMSLYAGKMMADPGFLFNNSADFIDFAGESLSYLIGTDPFVPGTANNELNTGKIDGGFYTLAVGGDEGFSFGGVDYTLNTATLATQVSEPSTFGIVLIMLAGLTLSRRYQGY